MIQIPLKCKRPISWIPNIDGYKVGVVTFKDGKYHDQIVTVRRGEDGLHKLAGVEFEKILGWFEVKQ